MPEQQTGTSGTDNNRRIEAVDALRGFDMFWIVGGRELALAVAGLWGEPIPEWVEYQLEHPAWIGFSAWDLIMPLFLFVVGVAMPFSFSKRLEQEQSKRELYQKIIRRSVILFALGMALQGHLLDFNLSTLHIFCNTLQAIAVGYLVAGILILHTGVVIQAAFTAIMLGGYWAILRYVPFAGHAAGTLEPDANVALAVDEYFLGRFRDGTAHTWILTGMSFAAMVLLGVLSGHLLRSKLMPKSKVAVLLGSGLFCLMCGWIWGVWLGFPFIKHIWTSSMVLWAAGWCYLLLGLFYLLIDVAGFRRWSFPFVVIGMNALTIYVASWFVPFRGIAESLVGGLARHLGSAGPTLIAASSVLLVWLVLYHLYRQRLFLRL